MHLAAVLVAFAGLLRVSEFAKTAGQAFKGLEKRHVTFSNDRDINGVPRAMVITVEKDKMNFFRYGTQIKIVRSYDSELCAVVAMHEYLKNDTRNDSDPLFQYMSPARRRRTLSRRHVSAWIKDMADMSDRPEGEFDTHSLRAGGATALWNSNYDAETISRIGRWSSNCWRIYVCDDGKRARNIQADMLATDENYLLYADLHHRIVDTID